MSHTETVRIVAEKSDENPHGFVVMNKADVDHDKHTVWVDPNASKEEKAEAKAEAKADAKADAQAAEASELEDAKARRASR